MVSLHTMRQFAMVMDNVWFMVEKKFAPVLLDGRVIFAMSQSYMGAMGCRLMIRLFVVEKDYALSPRCLDGLFLGDFVSVPQNGRLSQVFAPIRPVLVLMQRYLLFVVEKERVLRQIVVYAMLPWHLA
jgi:hypothetical protein